MRRISIRQITDNALVAAVYVAFTLATSSFSYLGIQFRIAEVLLLLCFYRKDYAFGLVVGTAIANVFSPLGWYDVLFGTLATLLACLAIGFSKRLWVAVIYPIVINGLVVGAELYFLIDLPFWANAGTVALGEMAVLAVGFFLFAELRKNRKFLEAIRANQNNR